jgi:tRNA threonylcarbamoyl adenosine modification protein YjeE
MTETLETPCAPAMRSARKDKGMAAPIVRTVELGDLAATRALGGKLAGALKAGDALLLSGALGAGKSELARAIIRACTGAAIDVPSPTFTLVQTYDTPALMLTHADLYRIDAVAELAELGLDEALETGALLVEWPDRAEGQWPASRLEIALMQAGFADGRRVTMTGFGGWGPRLAVLAI